MSPDWSAANDGAPGYVRAIIDRAVIVEPEARSWAEAAADLPARAGVVALEDATGRTILLGATADARRFVLRRCAPADGKRADVGAVAARARLVPVASGFEADLVYLMMSRERTPGAYAKLMARWEAWGVRLDPSDDFPEPRALRLADARGVSPATLIGPVSEQGAARLIERVIDAFDLCRYPHILRQAPRGTACAYKEMGRCPAPCDGSEPMESYRARVRDAVGAVGLPASEREIDLTARIRGAAGEARFEDAAALKKVLERIQSLDSGILSGVTTMDRYRHCVVTRGGTPGAARIYAIAGGRLVRVIDTDARRADVVEGVIREVTGQEVEVGESDEEMECLSVIARWAQTGAKRRVRVVRILGRDTDAEAVLSAMRAVVRSGSKDEPEEIEEIAHAGGESPDPTQGP